jgi:hypothetical protein
LEWNNIGDQGAGRLAEVVGRCLVSSIFVGTTSELRGQGLMSLRGARDEIKVCSSHLPTFARLLGIVSPLSKSQHQHQHQHQHLGPRPTGLGCAH